MKLWGPVLLGFIVGSLQLHLPTPFTSRDVQIAEYLANSTLPAIAFDTAEDFAKLAGDGPPPLPPRPSPRPSIGAPLELYASASDEVWEKAKCKGANFVRAMRGSDKEAGSIFKPPRDSAVGRFDNIAASDLEKWGWELKANRLEGNFENWGVDDTLRDIGSDDKCHEEGGSLVCIMFTHGEGGQDANGNWIGIDQQTYEADGRTYRKTGAHYGLGLDPEGVIIAMDRNSPQSAGMERTPIIEGDDLPALRPFSDLAWFSWKSLATDVKNLKYFMSLSIGNEETQSILSRAIREGVPGAQGFPVWKGYEFSTDTPWGQAILGTPNAQAFSYILSQHKPTLGNLYISRVRVFRDNREPENAPNLLLIVEPVPADGTVGKPEDQQNGKQARRRRHDAHRVGLLANL
ncbi:hypothetical protein N0V95_004525 [Ascochyta clinopodiicola]|nr:hypothetical protein N0V95_004525 [Ascochyta clinopodiicola]